MNFSHNKRIKLYGTTIKYQLVDIMMVVTVDHQAIKVKADDVLYRE